jgi:hypothetical protein
MPSQNQGGSQRQRRRFDELKDQIGEDPARWLDWDLFTNGHRRQLVRSLIKGIDTVERVRAWKAIERRLADQDDRKPRAKIMQWLDQREEWLELHGERPDRLQERDEPRDLPPVKTKFPDRDDIDTASDRSTFSSERAFGPLEERYPHLFDDGPAVDETSEPTGEVATDGGDQG